MTVWHKDAIPLETSIASRLARHRPSDLTFEMMDLAAVAISDPRYRFQCTMALAPEQFAEAICIECIPKRLCQATREAIEGIQIKARLLNKEAVPNLVKSTQNFVPDNCRYVACLKFINWNCDRDDFNA